MIFVNDVFKNEHRNELRTFYMELYSLLRFNAIRKLLLTACGCLLLSSQNIASFCSSPS